MTDIIKIIPFQESHVNDFKIRDTDAFSFKAYNDWKKPISEMMLATNGDSVSINGSIVSLFSIRTMWSGVGEAWTLNSTAINQYHVIIMDLSVSYISAKIIALGLHRLQCKVIVMNDSYHRWVKKLGFIQEAYLEQYGPLKEDYIQYCMILR